MKTLLIQVSFYDFFLKGQRGKRGKEVKTIGKVTREGENRASFISMEEIARGVGASKDLPTLSLFVKRPFEKIEGLGGNSTF